MNESVELKLTASEAALLTSTAQELGITPEQLAHSTLVDALHRLRGDQEFAEIVKHVLNKNRELYERLS